MAGRKVFSPRFLDRVRVPQIKNPDIQRAHTVIADAVKDLQSRRTSDVLIDVDLVVGTNKIPHGLGRPCVGVNVTPSTAAATFAYARNIANPRPDLEIWIDVVGVAMSHCTLEVF